MFVSRLFPILTSSEGSGDRISIKDILGGDYSSAYSNGQINLRDGIIALGISLILGLLIAIVYKKTFSGVIYSFTFDLSLLLMTVISTAIIITISSNVVLSLGMVGALSIVRFRAAIKDPVDIMYLFWAISAGIIVGAKQYLFALITCVLIALICICTKIIRNGTESYILIVRCAPETVPGLQNYLNSIKALPRNSTVTNDYSEFTVEVKSSNPNEIVNYLNAPQQRQRGVESAVLVKFNGEYCE